MVELARKNLIFMNLRMLHFEGFSEIAKRWMPHVKQVRTYCRAWAYRGIIPPNNEDPSGWAGIECVTRDLSLKELETVREIALKECDPEIPTICLIEIPVKKPLTSSRDEDEEASTIWWQNSQSSNQKTTTSNMEEVD
jgi:hypothetical protein